jgi:hypothetical protein
VDIASAQLDQWVGHGIPVIVIRDTPNFDAPEFVQSPADCLATNGGVIDDCRGRLDTDFYALAAGRLEPREAGIVDFTSLLCPVADQCPPIIGGIIAYKDSNHFSGTFVRSMEPLLDQALSATGMLPW